MLLKSPFRDSAHHIQDCWLEYCVCVCVCLWLVIQFLISQGLNKQLIRNYGGIYWQILNQMG